MEEFEQLSKDDKEHVLGLSFYYSRVDELPYEDRFRASRLSYSCTDPEKTFEAAVNTREWTIRCIDEQANRMSYQVLSYLPSSSWFGEDLKKIGGVAVEYKNSPLALLRCDKLLQNKIAVINLNKIIYDTKLIHNNKFRLQNQIKPIKTIGILGLSFLALSRVF
jgi:hypothetical protein